MPEIGIIITGKDTAGAALNATRRATDGLKDAISKLGDVATGFNQALEIGKKGMELFRMAFVDQIDAALRFRKANDPILKWFERMRRESELLRARLGDALLPVVQGLTEGFGLAGDGISKWVKENRKLIATGLLNFVIDVGNALTTVVAKGAFLVIKAWGGWQMIIETVKAGASKFFSLMSDGLASALEGVGGLARFMGKDGLANDILLVSENVRAMAQDFGDTAGIPVDAIGKINAEMDKQIEKLGKAERFVRSTLAKGYEQGMKRIAASTAGATKTIEEQIEAIDKLDDRVDAFVQRRIELINRASELELSIAKARDEKLAKIEEDAVARAEKTQERMISLSDFVVGVVETSMAAQQHANELLAEAQKASAEDSEEAWRKANEARQQVAEKTAKAIAIAFIDAATAQVAAMAATAAASAFANEVAKFGIFGLATGAVAAGAASAAVIALGAGLKGLVSGMADGGVVGGGIAGRDSVPVMLTPGEQVVSVGERAALQKFMGRLLGAQTGQTAGGLATGPATGGGQAVVQNINITQSALKPEQLAFDEVVRDMQPSVTRLGQQLKLSGQGVI